MAKKFTKDAGGTLFSAAKTVTKTAPKNDKENVKLTNPQEIEALKKFIDTKKKIDELTGELKEAESILKEKGKEIFISDMEKTGRRKESFILSNNDAGILYIAMDDYIYSNLDAERIAYLREQYGEDIVTTKTKYVFDEEMVEKHGEAISKAIMAIKTIPEDEKCKIIKAEESHRITKGTIDRMREIAQKFKTSVAALFADIMPKQQLKVRGK